MRRNNKLIIILMLTISFSFLLMNSVFAEDETNTSDNEFGNEECITNDDWSSKAKTDYNIDEASGKFVTSGLTAEQYRAQSNVEPKFVFYEVSEDGKTLTAYVDNYESNIKVEEIKKIIEDAGITVTFTCDHVLKVSKTMNESSAEGNNNENQGTEITGTDDTTNTVEKIQSPNTASPASLLAVSLGAVLVVVSVYVILNKKNGLNK